LEGLDDRTINILTPFLLYLEEINEELVFETFLERINEFVMKLTVEERNFLIGPV